MEQFFNITSGFDWAIVIIALITLTVIVGQLIVGLVVGADSDMDTDGDGSGDFDFSSILSPMAIIRFLCGSSWYLTCVLISGRLIAWYDYLISVVVGIFVMALIMLLYWGMSKLACSKDQEKGDTIVGRTGNIYLKLSDSEYEVMVPINGTITSMKVTSSHGTDYAVGATITVASYKDGIYYID